MNVNKINYIQPTFSGKYSMLKRDAVYSMANTLNIKAGDLYERTCSMNLKQQNFLEKLVSKYNSIYFYAKDKENPQNVLNIVQTIENPQRFHYDIVEYTSVTFENLLNILKSISTKEEADFVINLQKKILKDKQYPEKLLSDIVSSPYKKEYMKNTDNYKSYLRLNANNEDAIKNLDKMMAEGSYDSKVYDKQRDLNHIFQNKLVELMDAKDEIEKYYSPSGIRFIDSLTRSYYLPANYSKKDKANLIEIYKTCTPQNMYLREQIMQNYQEHTYQSNDFSEEIAAMSEVFKKIDNGNKYTAKFINKFLSNANKTESIQELNEILEAVPAEKAYIFYNNLLTILEYTKPGEERINALKNELTNYRFKNKRSTDIYKLRKNAEKYGYIQSESKFSKRIKYLKNEINKLRYYFVTKYEKYINGQKPENVGVAEVINTGNAVEKTKVAEVINEKRADKTTPSSQTNKIFTKVQKQKLEVQESVRQFINKRLHQSIVNEQERIYVNKATKMRLKMMPEILSSIKETRADLRKSGVKHPKISNFDAVDLYTRINGKNRKLVNYMLKKRNSDGTRMYSVTDIINELNKVNKRVVIERLKPSQTRKLYEDVLQEKVNEFGNLKQIKIKS